MSDSFSLAVLNTSQALDKRKFRGMHIAIIAGDMDRTASDQMIKVFRKSGIKCWTEQDMLPGSDRHHAMRIAYEEADFIIILLSKSSVRTQGEYQLRINMAMNANGFMPESGIKVIPVCLEPCDIPWSLQKLYHIDASQPDAPRRLVLAWAKEWQRRSEANDWPSTDYQSYWA